MNKGFLTEKEVNIIRGKALGNACSQKDILDLCGHIDQLEMMLDEASEEDFFGTEGWRHRAGIDE
jgi:hypothetical protein